MEMTPAGCFQGSPFLRSPVTSVVVWLNLLAPSPSFADDVIHTSATFAKGSQPVFSLVRRRRRLVQPTLDIGSVHGIAPRVTTSGLLVLLDTLGRSILRTLLRLCWRFLHCLRCVWVFSGKTAVTFAKGSTESCAVFFCNMSRK